MNDFGKCNECVKYWRFMKYSEITVNLVVINNCEMF